MLTLLAPILAQLVTVSAGDRTEARVVVVGDTHYEAVTRPLLGVTLQDRHLQWQLIYSPSFTLTPLEADPKLLVFHNGIFAASYVWHRTTVTASQYIGFGEQNFRVLATGGSLTSIGQTPGAGNLGVGTSGGAAGTPIGGTPVGGTGATPGTVNAAASARFYDQNVYYQNFVSSLGVTQSLSRSVALSGTISYVVIGAVETGVRYLYPFSRGPTLNLSLRDQYDRQNALTSTLAVNYTTATFGNAPPIRPEADTWLATATENWIHRFDLETSAQVGAGLSGGRNSRSDGYVAYNIYPTFLTNLSHVVRFMPSVITMTIGASSAPALDPLTLKLDPRVTLLANVTWQRERFFSSLSGASTFSVSGQQQDAFSAYGGAANIGYQLGTSVAMDGGVRAAYQDYQGVAVLPLSYAGFIGVTVGVNKPFR